MKWFVAMSGNIGSGKSALTTLFCQRLMDERDFRGYQDLFQMMVEFLRPPDLIVYLRAPVDVLLDRIRTRGRDFERRIPAAYLAQLNAQLNELYEDWVARFDRCPVLVIEAASVDLGSLDAVIAQMQQRLPSLFHLQEPRP